MEIFNRIIQRITGGGAWAAGVFLVASMLLVVTSVACRAFFNIGVVGTYELLQLMMGVVIAFALVYTALRKGHVVVNIVISRFSLKTGAIIGIAMAFLSLAIWGITSGAVAEYIYEVRLTELSETLEVPYLPFRAVFVLGLLLLALSYISDIYDGIRKVRGKWSQ